MADGLTGFTSLVGKMCTLRMKNTSDNSIMAGQALCTEFDVSAAKKLVAEIEAIEIPDVSELEKEINDYKLLSDRILILENEGKNLKAQLPEVCPVCGGRLKEGAALCF